MTYVSRQKYIPLENIHPVPTMVRTYIRVTSSHLMCNVAISFDNAFVCQVVRVNVNFGHFLVGPAEP